MTIRPKKILIQVGTIILKVAMLCAAAFLLYKVALFAYDYGFRIFAEKPVDREPGIDVNVAIVEGKSVKEIGKLLEEKGLIRDGGLFVWQEKFSEYAGELKPGAYTLNTSMTPLEMMAIMAAEQEETEGNFVREDESTEEDTETESEEPESEEN
ncbi:MAG: endolytic transglycosylase MltG [Lachnospiraceae bacterium]|nr:endolytic transglycosylase MltG [Lachnospiraceae bacterium]